MKPQLETPPKIELRPPEKRRYHPTFVALAAASVVMTPSLLKKLQGK